MRFEFSSGKKWFAAIFAVVAVAGIAMAVWNVRAHKASSSSTTTIAQKETAVQSTSPKPAEEIVSQFPKFVPGDTCEKASEALGPPTETHDDVRTWRQRDFAVFVGIDSKCQITGEEFSIETGHTVLTPDGVTLGKSTLADVERILQARIKMDSETVDAPEDHWEAMISVGPTPNFPFQTTYRANLDENKVGQMSRDPVFDDFRGQIVTDYSINLAPPAQSSK